MHSGTGVGAGSGAVSADEGAVLETFPRGFPDRSGGRSSQLARIVNGSDGQALHRDETERRAATSDLGKSAYA